MPTPIEEHDEYTCPKGTLRPGTRFRAKGGPYYRLENGTRTTMAAKGPFVFRAYYENGSRRWIEAFDGTGVCILNLGPQHAARLDNTNYHLEQKCIPREMVFQRRAAG